MKNFIVLCLVVGSLMFLGCGNSSKDTDALPTNATNIIDVGGGWVKFTLDGDRFLYNKSKRGYSGYQAITYIPNRRTVGE